MSLETTAVLLKGGDKNVPNVRTKDDKEGGKQKNRLIVGKREGFSTKPSIKATRHQQRVR